jgi:hypothetical protein
MEGWVGSGVSLDAVVRNRAGNRTPAAQPIARRYTDSYYSHFIYNSITFFIRIEAEWKSLFLGLQPESILKSRKSTNVSDEYVAPIFRVEEQALHIACFMQVSFLAYSSILKMETTCSPKRQLTFNGLQRNITLHKKIDSQHLK